MKTKKPSSTSLIGPDLFTAFAVEVFVKILITACRVLFQQKSSLHQVEYTRNSGKKMPQIQWQIGLNNGIMFSVMGDFGPKILQKRTEELVSGNALV